ncbi:MAG: TIM barrel protein [Gemmatimonadetes bacterium]|nr:TIM barrel protein [Gemmatimonadota bacterium]
MPEAAIRLSASISLMFREIPFAERFAAARQAGFEGVEIQVIEEADPATAPDLARAAGIEVVLLNVSLGDFRTGGPGLSGVPEREPAFRAALLTAADLADRLGARFLHLGPSRVPAGESRERCLAVYRDNLRFAAERSRDWRDRPVIEPLNVVETPDILLSSLDDAGALIEAAGSAIGLQYDLYHAVLNGVDLAATFDRHRRRIAHIQFADAPGRHEPGSGTVDFARFLSHLKAGGYRGWLGAEYFPTGATTASLAWLPDFHASVQS